MTSLRVSSINRKRVLGVAKNDVAALGLNLSSWVHYAALTKSDISFDNCLKADHSFASASTRGETTSC